MKIKLQAIVVDEAGHEQKIELTLRPTSFGRKDGIVTGNLHWDEQDGYFEFKEEGEFDAFPPRKESSGAW